MLDLLLSLIETCNIVFGLVLNFLLLFLINRYSKPQLGNYRILLKIFLCNDIFMVALHAVIKPTSMASGPVFGTFSRTFPDNMYVIILANVAFTFPFSLMNINFLHRYWSVISPHRVPLFSTPVFQLKLAFYVFLMAFTWFAGSMATADNPAGKAIMLREIANISAINMADGWVLMHFWDGDQLNIAGVLTLLVAGSVIVGNFTVAGILYTRSYTFLKSPNMLSSSPSYKMFQFKVLRALFVQSVIPVFFVYIPSGTGLSWPLFFRDKHADRLDVWYTINSGFPAVDAAVIILLMKDYRDGLTSMLCGSYRKTTVSSANNNAMTSIAPTKS